MGDEDWLGALEVGIAGHDVLACGFGEGDESFAPVAETEEGGVDGVAHEEAHVGGDLLIAAAAGVELEGEVADILRIVGELHALPFEQGAPRVYTVLKLDERRDKPGQTLADKVASVEAKLADG